MGIAGWVYRVGTPRGRSHPPTPLRSGARSAGGTLQQAFYGARWAPARVLYREGWQCQTDRAPQGWYRTRPRPPSPGPNTRLQTNKGEIKVNIQ